jgi:serine/threonine protein phosphatase PrpC
MIACAITNRGGRAYQEDRIVMHHDPHGRYALYAVFDGHGGSAVAELCQTTLVRHVKQLMSERVWRLGSAHVLMNELFARLDAGAQALNMPHTGCTAVVALIMAGHVICANAGDSRAIMGKEKVVTMTKDHKVQDEVDRLLEAGALITQAPGDTPRIARGLNLARSIGDHALKRWVTSSPYVSVYKAPKGAYLLLASDGVWDVMDDKAVHKVVLTARRQGAVCHAALQTIVRHCRERRSTDNVSIVLAPVDILGPPTAR